MRHLLNTALVLIFVACWVFILATFGSWLAGCGAPRLTEGACMSPGHCMSVAPPGVACHLVTDYAGSGVCVCDRVEARPCVAILGVETPDQAAARCQLADLKAHARE